MHIMRSEKEICTTWEIFRGNIISNFCFFIFPPQISEDGRGVASMANMLTMTRIHTAMGAASSMRRLFIFFVL